jgi:DNA-binding MarR family transcriptional regulator
MDILLSKLTKRGRPALTTNQDPTLQRIELALLRIMRSTTTRRAHRRWTREAGLDIAHVQSRILNEVCAHGPLRSADVARALDVEPPLVSREVKRLEEHGLISRAADGDDRRAHLVQATAAGRRTHAKYRATLDKNIDAAVRKWTRRDLEQLAVLLERFATDVTMSTAEQPGGKTC